MIWLFIVFIIFAVMIGNKIDKLENKIEQLENELEEKQDNTQ